MSEEKKVVFTSRLPESLIKRLKVFAVVHSLTVEDCLERAIRRELDRKWEVEATT